MHIGYKINELKKMELSLILLHMCTKEKKEVTEVLFCKKIIRILIASIIEIVISNKKPRFDVLIKSQLP